MKVEVSGVSGIYWNGELWDRKENITAWVVAEDTAETDMINDNALFMLLEDHLRRELITEEDGDHLKVGTSYHNGKRAFEIYITRYNLPVEDYTEDDLKKTLNDVVDTIEAAVKEYKEKKFTFEAKIERTI